MVNWKPSKAELKAFRPIFRTERKRMESLDEDSKLRHFWDRWMSGRADNDIHDMNLQMFKDGGPWDQAAGKDHMMQLEEAAKLNEMIRKKFSEKAGEEVPKYKEGQFKKVFEAYDSLSEGNGFSKHDAIMGQFITNWLRDQMVSDVERDMYNPLGWMIYDAMDDLPEDNKLRARFFNEIRNPNGEEHKKGMKEYMKAFDHFDKNHDGRLNQHEWHEFDKVATKWVEENIDKGPEWSHGDKRFFWTMADAVSDGRWNHGHSPRDNGNITKADVRRMDRIMKKVYQDVDEEA